MFCPYCGFKESKVIDSRAVDEAIRRRRECLGCKKRFTTYERVQTTSLLVIKKDGRREEYNRDKLVTGMRKACEKRPLPAGTVDKIADEIEAILYQTGKTEIPSSTIGELVMEKLKSVDYIAYIRFASVYREFTDITALKKAVDSLVEVKQEEKGKPLPNQLPLLPEDSPLITKSGRRKRK